MLLLKSITVETLDGKRVLENVDLAIPPGKVTVLMGPNGSGKSSLLYAIMGHPKYTLKAGTIEMSGENITALPTEEKAKKGIFLSLQHVPEIPGVTMVNFLHRAYQATTKEEMSVLDFYTKLKALAQSLDISPEFVKRELHTGFSGGEKKISEILQMALLAPRYALLDEIDSGVDVDALKKILSAVDRVRSAGTGVLLITHYPTLLEYLKPDQVAVMVKGKIVASGGEELAKEILASGFKAYE